MKLTTVENHVTSKNNSAVANECVWPQIVAIIAVSLGSFTDGVIFGWMMPFMVKIAEDKVNYDISESEAANLAITQPITLVISALLLSNLCDVIGRKNVLLILCAPQILCLVISAFARSIYVFYVARVFAGVNSALLWLAVPMYLGEVASPKVRGVWGNLITSSLFAGQFVVNVAGSYCDAATTSYIFLPIPILFLIVLSFMPETPYFYLMKKNYESAEKSIKFLTRKNNIEDDLLTLKNDVERQMSESGTWKDLVTIDSNRRALLAGLFLRFSTQFSGVSIFNQYTQFIFNKSGSSVTPQTASIIYTGLCVILNIVVVLFVIDKFGRKILFATSMFFSSLLLFVMSGYFYVDEILPNFDISSFNWIPITALLSYQATSSFGLNVLPSLMMSELFSTSIKGKALIVLVIAIGLGNFVTNLIFNSLIFICGNYGPFLFFGCCAALCTMLTFYFVPETKDKTLEEIQMMLKRRSTIKQNSA